MTNQPTNDIKTKSKRLNDLKMTNPLNENLTESDIQKACIDYLQYNGWMILRINSGAVASEYTYKRGERKGQTVKRFFWLVRWFVLGIDPQTRGVFDTIAIRGGVALAVDYKKPGETLTLGQKLFMAEWQGHGGIALGEIGSVDELVLRLMEALAK